jgi:hypothetical protein
MEIVMPLQRDTMAQREVSWMSRDECPTITETQPGATRQSPAATFQ